MIRKLGPTIHADIREKEIKLPAVLTDPVPIEYYSTRILLNVIALKLKWDKEKNAKRTNQEI